MYRCSLQLKELSYLGLCSTVERKGVIGFILLNLDSLKVSVKERWKNWVYTVGRYEINQRLRFNSNTIQFKANNQNTG